MMFLKRIDKATWDLIFDAVLLIVVLLFFMFVVPPVHSNKNITIYERGL